MGYSKDDLLKKDFHNRDIWVVGCTKLMCCAYFIQSLEIAGLKIDGSNSPWHYSNIWLEIIIFHRIIRSKLIPMGGMQKPEKKNEEESSNFHNGQKCNIKLLI